jgi:glycogen debranching enzyme
MADLEGGSGLDSIQILEGSTFMLSDLRGDVDEDSLTGLFHEDTRYLNRFVLTVDGKRPLVLSSAAPDYGSAAFFLTNPALDGIPAKSLSIQRYRSIGDGLTEVLVLHNHGNVEVELEVRLSCGADFADLFEVKSQNVYKRGRLSASGEPAQSALVFEYDRDEFRAATRIHATEDPQLEGHDLVFRIRLPARCSWKTRIQVALRSGERVFQPLTQEEREASRALRVWRELDRVRSWRDEAPSLEAGWDLLQLVYEKSVDDLAALRLHANVEGNEFSLPAAGLPWFMAIFGRDTLITAYQSLLIGPELARGALHSLAGLQGKELNDFKDEEPGKILHEIRFGELTVLGETPHRPYYGTVDATPLFLVLLSEYWRLTGDDGTVETLRDNAVRALEWIDRHGDRDGDGYVEYQTRSEQGLANQGWKDSGNGVQFADGSLPQPPLALCEVQGYVHDAKLRTAELAEQVWRDTALAQRLREQAARLYERFNADFWIDGREGYYALALDAEKRQVDSLTSNIGHLLWSGIVPEARAEPLVEQLFSAAMWSGWGIRTLSSDERGYNPIGYHLGTVWPHDNSLVAAGLYRYGFREHANQIALAMLEAAAHSGFRLPEVFAGYPRSDTGFPVRYPTACSPQAWAAGTPLLLLRVLLDLQPLGERVQSDHADTHLPPRYGRVRLSGIHTRRGRESAAS